MTDLRVSCVIPTHGRPDFLREAIESLVSQSLAPHEVVVVSDDNNAESEKVVAEFGGRDVPVRFVRNSDTPGASGSRNLGACESVGEWLAFLDDDDLWKPDVLHRSVEIATKTQTDCVVTWLEIFRDKQTAPGLRISPSTTARTAGARNPGVTGSNFIMRRTVFDGLGGFDPELRVLNDIDFFYRHLLSGGQFEVNERPDVLQRRHSSGQLTRATEMRAAGVEKYLTKHSPTLRFSEVRHLRLMSHRIRYRAADTPQKKLAHLVLGALNASPINLRKSVESRSQKKVWHER